MAIGTGLRMRLGLGLALVAVVAVLGTAWGAHYLVKRTFEEMQEEAWKRITGEADRVWQSTVSDLRGRISAIREDLLMPPGRFEHLASSPATRSAPEVTGTAERLQRLAGLDVLLILDGQGTVISSGHWPQQAGITAAGYLSWPNGPVITEMGTATESVPVLAIREEFGDSGRPWILIGGIRFNDALIREIVPLEFCVLRDSEGRNLARTDSSVEEPWPGWENSDPHDLGFRLPVANTVSETGVGRAALVGFLDRTSSDRVTGEISLLFAGVGAVVALLAFLVGLWVSRAVTRPLDDMTRAMESVTAGEADYTFPSPGGGEFQELVVTFSRMRRSLDLQKERLKAVERVAAWREAARRVAHEVKNPLAPIRLTMENLLKARDSAPEMFDGMFEDGARAILEEVEQLRRIVTEFGEYARLPEPAPEPADLDRLVDAVASLYSTEEGVEIVRIRDAELPSLQLDPDQVSRALKNIVANAVEALGPEGGRVTVRTFLDDRMAGVEVVDTGEGLGAGAAERIFDPYFTTKKGGTGLGMAITDRIVTEHGGLLKAENVQEGGARIVLLLPVPSEGNA